MKQPVVPNPKRAIRKVITALVPVNKDFFIVVRFSLRLF